MAGDLLMSISQDERERAVFRSHRMYQTDLESDLATAEDRGKRKGGTYLDSRPGVLLFSGQSNPLSQGNR